MFFFRGQVFESDTCPSFFFFLLLPDRSSNRRPFFFFFRCLIEGCASFESRNPSLHDISFRSVRLTFEKSQVLD